MSTDRTLTVFKASWCQSCPAVASAVKAYAAKNHIDFATADMEADAALANKLGVRGVPTVVYQCGEVTRVHAGSMPTKDRLDELVRERA